MKRNIKCTHCNLLLKRNLIQAFRSISFDAIYFGHIYKSKYENQINSDLNNIYGYYRPKKTFFLKPPSDLLIYLATLAFSGIIGGLAYDYFKKLSKKLFFSQKERLKKKEVSKIKVALREILTYANDELGSVKKNHKIEVEDFKHIDLIDNKDLNYIERYRITMDYEYQNLLNLLKDDDEYSKLHNNIEMFIYLYLRKYKNIAGRETLFSYFYDSAIRHTLLDRYHSKNIDDRTFDKVLNYLTGKKVKNWRSHSIDDIVKIVKKKYIIPKLMRDISVMRELFDLYNNKKDINEIIDISKLPSDKNFEEFFDQYIKELKQKSNREPE